MYSTAVPMEDDTLSEIEAWKNFSSELASSNNWGESAAFVMTSANG